MLVSVAAFEKGSRLFSTYYEKKTIGNSINADYESINVSGYKENFH